MLTEPSQPGIETRDLEHCSESHGTFLWTQIFFGLEIFIGPKIFWTQNFWNQHFLDQQFFWAQNFFEPKNLLHPKFFRSQNFLDSTFFWTQHFFGTNIYLE